MKSGKLTGKIAVVTGASKGIGADIAKAFATEGASVVVNYASAKEGADRVVDEITKRGGKAISVQGSVTKKADVEKLFAATKQDLARAMPRTTAIDIWRDGRADHVIRRSWP